LFFWHDPIVKGGIQDMLVEEMQTYMYGLCSFAFDRGAELVRLADKLSRFGAIGVFVFNKMSWWLLLRATKTPVYDVVTRKLVGFLRDPGDYLHAVLLGEDPRFVRSHPYRADPSMCSGEARDLHILRIALIERLRQQSMLVRAWRGLAGFFVSVSQLY